MAEVVRDALYQPRQGFRLADMAGMRNHAAAKFAGDAGERLLFAPADDGRRPFARERGGDGFAYPAAPTGDNGDFVFELHGANQRTTTRSRSPLGSS